MLQGNLSDLPFLDLLQTLASGSGGVLTIEAPGVDGVVGFSSRRVTSAEALGLTGMDALTLLAGLKRGQFTFNPTPPLTSNLEAPLEALLTDLIAISDEWKKLTHIPDDWSRTLRQVAGRKEVEIPLRELGIFAEAEGKTIAEILAVPGQVLERARALDRLLKNQALTSVPTHGLGPVVLVALPYYGPFNQTAYIDYGLYQRWAEKIGGPFKLRVRSPKGLEATFPVEPREQIPERIMLHDQALRKLRASRGTRLKVMPEVEDGLGKP